ncbi:hypothetical protein HDU97_008231 [Phlyctochytrium planicorne]|nr:hypothetical protein HDU97_008231 [Phlyctochytrium planicorne]
MQLLWRTLMQAPKIIPQRIPCTTITITNRTIVTGIRRLAAHPLRPRYDITSTRPEKRTPIYTKEMLESFRNWQPPPASPDLHTSSEVVAYILFRILKFGLNLLTLTLPKPQFLSSNSWFRRFIFLETLSSVPGFMGSMIRHIRSLKSLQDDKGWIPTLLDDTENHRAHLMSWMMVGKPGAIMTTCVVITQGLFYQSFFVVYAVSQQTVHRFLTFVAEDSVKTYTICLEDVENGKIQDWKNRPAPKQAIE